jgi:hypothetical protein
MPDRYGSFGLFRLFGFIDIVFAPAIRLWRWVGYLVAEAFPVDDGCTGNEIILSRRLTAIAGTCRSMIGASLHAAGVGILAMLPIGIKMHDRRAGFALA